MTGDWHRCRICKPGASCRTRRLLLRHYVMGHVAYKWKVRYRRWRTPERTEPRCFRCGGSLRRRRASEWMGAVPVACTVCGTEWSLSRHQPLLDRLPLSTSHRIIEGAP